MTIPLIEGAFKSNDAINLLSNIIESKIKFHETKIKDTDVEEDIKYRETKIKQLQNLAFELKETLKMKNQIIELNAIIKIQ